MSTTSPVPAALDSFVVSRSPLELHVRAGRWTGMSALVFATGAVMLALFIASVLGWFGVIAMGHDGFALLGSIASLGFGLFFIVVGAQPRWGRVEMVFETDGVSLVHAIGPWRRALRVSPPAHGGRMILAIQGGRKSRDLALFGHWLAVRLDRRSPTISIGGGFGWERPAIEAVGSLVAEWARCAGIEVSFDASRLEAAEHRDRAR